MHQIVVSDIVVDVVRKDIKNLHLAVYPPNGRVRVAVPLYIEDDAVRLAVIAKLAWIKRQQRQFDAQERQTERQYISGESHYFQGHRYLLHVEYRDETPSVKIRNKKIMELVVRPGSEIAQRERVLSTWYRQQLKQQTVPLIPKWEHIIQVDVAEWRIKQMKTKWGSCNIEARRIWLNLELAKKSIQCLEYIIVHEMVHLLERHHNARFNHFMDTFLPNWRMIREELNREPLAHEIWDY
jgi:predicted metal-dependent hydrolase